MTMTMDEIEKLYPSPVLRPGATFVCEVPKALGRVVKLEIKSGKVVATGETGMKMIVGTGGVDPRKSR